MRDLLSESLTSLLGKSGRMVLTAVGTVLGIAALVAIAGLTSTTGNQITSRFDELAATEVVVTPAELEGSPVPKAIPWDAEQRLGSLNGVRAVGTLTDIDVGTVLARTVPVIDLAGRAEQRVPVVAGSQGLVSAVRGVIASGRAFDIGHDERADRVALLGVAVARELGLAPLDRRPAIFLGDIPFTVVGIIEHVERESRLLSSIVIPNGTAKEVYGLESPGEVHVDTEIGAARLISSQVSLALAPEAPERLEVRVAPEPRQTRARVEGDMTALFVVLGGVSLLIGALGIANTTLVSVLERTGEIGLRRSLGATRSHIAAQFIVESTAVGLLGGVIGASLGLIVVVGVSAIQTWTPVLDLRLPLVAVAVGAIIGLLAGAYPAWRAGNIEPISALRTEA